MSITIQAAGNPLAGQTEFTSEQKSQAGVIVTIGHNGKPVYHCGLVERGAKPPLSRARTTTLLPAD
jgi:hypothetical protein